MKEISCSDYSTLKMEAMCSSEYLLTFNGLHGVISRNMVFITSVVTTRGSTGSYTSFKAGDYSSVHVASKAGRWEEWEEFGIHLTVYRMPRLRGLPLVALNHLVVQKTRECEPYRSLGS
jgi:hypothetical protein